MNKKCPCCGNEVFQEMTKDKTKFGLVKVNFANGNSSANFNEILPVNVSICKKCGFIAMYHPNLQSREQ